MRPTGNKSEQYAQLLEQARALLHGEHDRIANAANFAALVWYALPDINWCGFYFSMAANWWLVRSRASRPACASRWIGVCGAAATTRQVQCVADVHAFPGHIACDAASRSEIVVPLILDNTLLGVWDVDSPLPNRFDEEDASGMQALCAIFLDSLKPSKQTEAAA